MGNYEKYLAQLKEQRISFDSNSLYSQLEIKITRTRRRKIEFALAGTLAIMLVGFALFYYQPADLTGNGVLSDYLTQPSELNGDPVINYIFTE